MRSLGGSRFEKQRCYPSSDIPPSYHRLDLAGEQTPRIVSHLASCDFCAAELQLLSKRPAVEQLREGTVPQPDLGVLATAILTEDSFKTEELLFRLTEKARSI